ncbi:MAG: hypothetical protein C9356_20065 [Oleiphilus sp.]|nr:MAG: hypothetical protein C9356_20065 [Oleiphilus sp.]
MDIDKSIIRLSIALENLGGFILLGLMFIGIALADGLAQLFLGVVGIAFGVALVMAMGSVKEHKFYGLYDGTETVQDDKKEAGE